MKTILKKEYWNKISNKLIPIFVFLIIFLLTIYNTNKFTKSRRALPEH